MLSIYHERTSARNQHHSATRPTQPTLPMSVAAASGFAAATSHGWRAGHCGTTVNGQGNACARLDAKGSWASASRESCLSRCVRCEHCQFISYSDRFQDCSWYRTCKPKKLEATSGTGHETRRVRDGAGNLTLMYPNPNPNPNPNPTPNPNPDPNPNQGGAVLRDVASEVRDWRATRRAAAHECQPSARGSWLELLKARIDRDR